MTITRFSTGQKGDSALIGNTSFSASDMEWISTIRVGSGGASSVTFSNIPQEYKHLQIRFIARDTGTDNLLLRINGDTGSNYVGHRLYGDGVSAASAAATAQTYIRVGGVSSTANIFGVGVVDILDYVSSPKRKTVRSLGGWDLNGSGSVHFTSGVWLPTADAAVTSLTLLYSTLQQFSKFSLYGIRG